MSLASRVIIGLVLFAYTVTASFAGLGGVIVCQYAGGGFCVEKPGDRCCDDEPHTADEAAGRSIATTDSTPTPCGDCVEIPLGEMPARERVGEVVVMKVAVPAQDIHLPATLSGTFEPAQTRVASSPSVLAPVSGTLISCLESVVILC